MINHHMHMEDMKIFFAKNERDPYRNYKKQQLGTSKWNL